MSEDQEIEFQIRWAAEIDVLERQLAIWVASGFVSTPQLREAAERKQLLQRELELSKKRQALKASAEQAPPEAAEAEQSKPADRGKYCCKVIEEVKKIKNLHLGTGRSVAEIQTESPDMVVWKLRESLTPEDQETFNHPNQWGPPVGYAKNILAKTFDRRVHTITSWVKAYRKSQQPKKP